MHSKDESCSDFRRGWISRREWLWSALSVPTLLQARSQSPSQGTFGRAKSIIILYLHGGHAQQETWDPKPNGPSPERGEFGAISSSVAGTQISEMLPLCSKLVHRLAIIRSMTHDNANHVQACLPAMTGHAHPKRLRSRGDFPPSSTDFPPFGAVMNHLRPAIGMPTWIQLGPLMRRNNGTVLHGQVPGFLGNRHAPLMIDQDFRKDRPEVEAVAPSVSTSRLTSRRNLLQKLDVSRSSEGEKEKDLRAYQQRALDLLTSSKVARACDLSREPLRSRERYGRTEFGQRCLLARRLVEVGVPIVNVHYCRTPRQSWDTHGRHFKQMKASLGPTFDRAFSALVEDVAQRGLLDETLILATAEFGRTPKINKNAGRDHWPWVYSLAMAGGGTRPGVFGASDKIAAYPTESPRSPQDMAATIYHLLGVEPSTIIKDQQNRPHSLIIGKKIDGLIR